MLGDISGDELVLSNSMLHMLDALDDARPNVRLVARTWLRESLPRIARILDPLCSVLLK